MTLEYVGTIEALLNRRARPGAKVAHHGALVVGQSVAVLIILASKALLVIFARDNWTLLWPL